MLNIRESKAVSPGGHHIVLCGCNSKNFRIAIGGRLAVFSGFLILIAIDITAQRSQGQAVYLQLIKTFGKLLKEGLHGCRSQSIAEPRVVHQARGHIHRAVTAKRFIEHAARVPGQRKPVKPSVFRHVQ